MRYIVRKNFRHNGKLYMLGDKPDFAILNEDLRMRVRARFMEPVAPSHVTQAQEAAKVQAPAPAAAAKTEEKPEAVEAGQGQPPAQSAAATDEKGEEKAAAAPQQPPAEGQAPAEAEKKPGILDKIGDAVKGVLGKAADEVAGKGA